MVKVPAYYAPMVRNWLFSTTSLLQTYTDESIKIKPHQLVLSGVPGNLTQGELVALINPENNLPTSEANSFKDTPIAVKALNIAISTVNASNFNLSKLEKELLCWAHEPLQNPIPHAHQHPEQVRSQPTPSHCILQDCRTSQVRSMPIWQTTSTSSPQKDSLCCQGLRQCSQRWWPSSWATNLNEPLHLHNQRLLDHICRQEFASRRGRSLMVACLSTTLQVMFTLSSKLIWTQQNLWKQRTSLSACAVILVLFYRLTFQIMEAALPPPNTRRRWLLWNKHCASLELERIIKTATRNEQFKQ